MFNVFLCARLPRFTLYVSHQSLPKPFGVRVASVVQTLNVPSVSVSPCRYPRLGYCQFQDISVNGPAIANENLFPDYESPALFIEHYSAHSDSIPVFTDGLKFEGGVEFGVVFPSFF